MTSRTNCARLAFISSSSASEVIAWLAGLCLSVWRISSPMGVPPGSRRVRTRWPIERRRSANKEIWVVFPLPSVPSNVMNGTFMSQAFGSCTFGCVLNHPAFGLQLVADRVGAFEISGFARSLPGFDQSGNFRRHFHFFGRADAQYRIQLLPGDQRRRSGGGVHRILRQLSVSVADPFKNRAPGAGDVQVIIQGGREFAEQRQVAG